MGLATYAAHFASIGYACVVFDYRRWGTSGDGLRHSSRMASALKATEFEFRSGATCGALIV